MNLFFFWIFCFLAFSRIFQEVKKSENFVFFSYKWNLRNVFELKFWHEKLSSFEENCFGASYGLLLRMKNFFFLDSRPFLDQFETKKTENLKKNSKNVQLLKFYLWLCGRNFGRSAENSVKNILLPKILTKTFWVKSDHYIILKYQKVDPPEWTF